MRWVTCVAVYALALHCAVSSAQPAEIWDPPAIQVFPDHDSVAHDPSKLPVFIEDGRKLFQARFNKADGAGRPQATGDSKPTPRMDVSTALSRTSGPDAMSCAACHTQPAIGGSGDMPSNVFVGAHFAFSPAKDVSSDATNERNTTSLFGTGVIEMLAREMTMELHRARDRGVNDARATSKEVSVALHAKGVAFGTIVARPDGTVDTSRLRGVDPDLVVRPFGVKGIAASLREFTIAALNQHHGIEAVERFGWARTGLKDFDGDGVEVEFTIGQLSALVVFQASLPPLVRTAGSNDRARARALDGERLFQQVGCTGCHVPYLELSGDVFSEPNPFNRPGSVGPEDVDGPIVMRLPSQTKATGIQHTDSGTLRVWAYSDLRRHVICDAEEPFFCNEKLRQDNFPTDQFLTSKLWDLAESAPYGHRGDCGSVSEAIVHHGGEATISRKQFQRLTVNEKRELIEFLLTLGAGGIQVSN